MPATIERKMLKLQHECCGCGETRNDPEARCVKCGGYATHKVPVYVPVQAVIGRVTKHMALKVWRMNGKDVVVLNRGIREIRT